MRVVLVNWARIWDGASSGGGVNGYCQNLALALLRAGHEVISLCGGNTYVPGAHGQEPGQCEVRRHPDWLGVRVFEVVNSPVLAPSFPQFRDPSAEVSSPELEARAGALFALLRPDIVHFHNIEGFSIGCVDAARAAGAAVFFSLHNYQPVCPQVYLMQRHREPCFSYDNGHACVNCIETPDPAAEKARRAAANRPPPPIDDGVPDAARANGAESVLSRLAGEIRSKVRPRPAAAPPQPLPQRPPPLPGLPVRGEAEATAPLPIAGPDTRGKTLAVLAELEPRRWPSPLDPEWRPVENIPSPDPSTGRPLNGYGRRREAMIAMLSRCDRVLAVSNFVRDKYIALGVDAAVIETLHIGTRAGEIAARHAELVFDPPQFDPANPRPIRLVFIGVNHWYKGVSMLADTLELLAPEYLRQIDLSIHALGGETIEWRFRRLEPRLAALRFSLGYQPQDIPWICGGRDLGLVPSVWWDNAPQTVFEFLACGIPVLAADIGGIPDFITHGHNGLLHRANDRFALARALVDVIRDPSILPRLRANVRPPKPIDLHAAELESLYRQRVTFRGRTAPPPAPSPAALGPAAG